MAKSATDIMDKQCELIARALSEPRRVEILRQLGECSGSLACSCLQQAHAISAGTLSHHLKELERAGLIEILRDGKFANIKFKRKTLRAYSKHLASI